MNFHFTKYFIKFLKKMIWEYLYTLYKSPYQVPTLCNQMIVFEHLGIHDILPWANHMQSDKKRNVKTFEKWIKTNVSIKN